MASLCGRPLIGKAPDLAVRRLCRCARFMRAGGRRPAELCGPRPRRCRDKISGRCRHCGWSDTRGAMLDPQPLGRIAAIVKPCVFPWHGRFGAPGHHRAGGYQTVQTHEFAQSVRSFGTPSVLAAARNRHDFGRGRWDRDRLRGVLCASAITTAALDHHRADRHFARRAACAGQRSARCMGGGVGHLGVGRVIAFRASRGSGPAQLA